MNHLHYYLVVGELHKALLHGLHGALYICLHDNGQLLHIACLDLAEQIV